MKSVTEYTATESVQGQGQHSLLDNIMDRIERFIDEEREIINLNFPLSGGDEQIHIYKMNETEEKSNTWTSFLQVLETDFPLSGGEAEW